MDNKPRLLALALLALSPNLAAQVPGAGAQLRQVTPPASVPPPASTPTIRIEETPAADASADATMRVRVFQLRVSGAHAFAEEELLALTGFVPGSDLTLAELHAMAARIGAHYRSEGYFVARATLPAQEIVNGVVTIAVSEGVYGDVTLRDESGLSRGVTEGQLQGLERGDTIQLEPLEERLLRLSDIPGVTVRSTLVPGSAPGSSDLLVDVVPGRRFGGYVSIDNGGNPHTGEWLFGAGIDFYNPLGFGDVASLQAITSGDGLDYARASYEAMFGRATAGIAYSHLDYRLGNQFEVLGANGTADVASLYGSYPLIRSRRANLDLGAIVEHRRLEDRLDLFPADGRRVDIDVAGLSLSGNRQDDFGGGGTNYFHVALSFGSVDIRTPAALAIDELTARTNGSYAKAWFNVSRLQRVTDTLSVHGSLTGQLASGNLDASEKFVLGGIAGIRGYPQGEAFGDEGYLASVEARWLLGGLSSRMPGDVHLLGFVEGGHVRISKDPWDASPNTRDLGAAGVGASWSDPGRYAVRAVYAVPLGGEEAISAEHESGRFWLQAIRYF